MSIISIVRPPLVPPARGVVAPYGGVSDLPTFAGIDPSNFTVFSAWAPFLTVPGYTGNPLVRTRETAGSTEQDHTTESALQSYLASNTSVAAVLYDQGSNYALGSELVGNSDFDSGLTGYTTSGSVTDNMDGTVDVVDVGGTDGIVGQQIVAAAGSIIRISATITASDGLGKLRAGSSILSEQQFAQFLPSAFTGTWESTFFLTSANPWVAFATVGTNASITLDALSCKVITGRHVLNATAANQPDIKVTSGLVEIDYSATTDVLRVQSGLVDPTQDFDMIFAGDSVSAGGNRAAISFSNADASPALIGLQRRGNGRWQIEANDNADVSSNIGIGNDVGTGQIHVVRATRRTGSNFSTQVYGQSAASALTNTGTYTLNRCELGRVATSLATVGAQGGTYFAAVTQPPLTAAEWATVAQRLAAKLSASVEA